MILAENNEIPAWVNLVREDIQGSESRTSQSLEALEGRLMRRMQESVTKDLFDAEKTHREDQHTQMMQKIRELEAERRDDKKQYEADLDAVREEAEERRRSFRKSLWGVIAMFLTISAGIFAAALPSILAHQ